MDYFLFSYIILHLFHIINKVANFFTTEDVNFSVFSRKFQSTLLKAVSRQNQAQFFWEKYFL